MEKQLNISEMEKQLQLNISEIKPREKIIMNSWKNRKLKEGKIEKSGNDYQFEIINVKLSGGKGSENDDTVKLESIKTTERKSRRKRLKQTNQHERHNEAQNQHERQHEAQNQVPEKVLEYDLAVFHPDLLAISQFSRHSYTFQEKTNSLAKKVIRCNIDKAEEMMTRPDQMQYPFRVGPRKIYKGGGYYTALAIYDENANMDRVCIGETRLGFLNCIINKQNIKARSEENVRQLPKMPVEVTVDGIKRMPDELRCSRLENPPKCLKALSRIPKCLACNKDRVNASRKTVKRVRPLKLFLSIGL